MVHRAYRSVCFLVFAATFLLTACTKPAAPLSSPVPTKIPSASIDPLSAWKTYTDPTYKYQLKYPPEWTVTHDTELNKTLTKISNHQESLSIFYEGGFNHGLDPWELEKSLTLTLDSHPAQMNVFSLSGNQSWWPIITLAQYPDFRIEALVPADRLEMLQQILATFTFPKDTHPVTLVCPENGWIDCLPEPNRGIKYECTDEAQAWFVKNCPNFRGQAQ